MPYFDRRRAISRRIVAREFCAGASQWMPERSRRRLIDSFDIETRPGSQPAPVASRSVRSRRYRRVETRQRKRLGKPPPARSPSPPAPRRPPQAFKIAPLASAELARLLVRHRRRSPRRHWSATNCPPSPCLARGKRASAWRVLPPWYPRGPSSFENTVCENLGALRRFERGLNLDRRDLFVELSFRLRPQTFR